MRNSNSAIPLLKIPQSETRIPQFPPDPPPKIPQSAFPIPQFPIPLSPFRIPHFPLEPSIGAVRPEGNQQRHMITFFRIYDAESDRNLVEK